MQKYNRILRFRFDNETAEILSSMTCSSQYVRDAVSEKLEKDNMINSQIPF